MPSLRARRVLLATGPAVLLCGAMVLAVPLTSAAATGNTWFAQWNAPETQGFSLDECTETVAAEQFQFFRLLAVGFLLIEAMVWVALKYVPPRYPIGFRGLMKWGAGHLIPVILGSAIAIGVPWWALLQGWQRGFLGLNCAYEHLNTSWLAMLQFPVVFLVLYFALAAVAGKVFK